MRKFKKLCCSAIVAGVGVVGFGSPLHAQLPESSSYYEKDGLLDITEWFDGNNYNPTDEAWWRIDDETYQAAKDTSGDSDSDRDGWYGYTTRDDDDWYYDYYDPYPYSYYDFDDNAIYEYWSRYYDYDNDGTYDAFASYSDSDGDGFYDDYDYYSFDTTIGQQNQQAQQQKKGESRQMEVSGKVQKTKLVKVRGGKQHVVVAIQPEKGQAQQNQQVQQNQQGQMLIVDLGNADDLKDLNPKLGNEIKVKGPRAQVGKQSVVLAREIELNGQTKQINRDANSFTGKVTDTHKTKIRGTEHLIAMVEVKKQDKAHKIAVDLGPADKLQVDVKKDANLTFTGFPVKVKDKPLIVAQSIQKDDQFVQINRQSSSPAEQAQPAGNRQQGQQGQQGQQNPQGQQ